MLQSPSDNVVVSPVPAMGSPSLAQSRSRRASAVTAAPASPSPRPAASTSTPARRVSSLSVPHSSPRPLKTAPAGSAIQSPRRSVSATTAGSSTLVSPASVKTSATPIKALGSPASSPTAISPAPRASAPGDSLKAVPVPRITTPPKVVQVISIPDCERGAVDFEAGRVVGCQRTGSRSRDGGRLFIAGHTEESSAAVIGVTRHDHDGDLPSPAKNVRSLAVDRQRIAVRRRVEFLPRDPHG